MLLSLDGRTASDGSPLLMHSEALADPLSPQARALAKFTGKRKKTEADHIEISRLEFLGGMYTNGNGPCLPTWNILRSLQDGAKRHKLGPDVLRGVHPIEEHADVHYEGPRDPAELWADGGYVLRKGVGVSRRKVMRTRPMFVEWQSEAIFEIDPVVWDLDTLAKCWADTGKYVGIGDGRPIYGRFKATLKELK